LPSIASNFFFIVPPKTLCVFILYLPHYCTIFTRGCQGRKKQTAKGTRGKHAGTLGVFVNGLAYENLNRNVLSQKIHCYIARLCSPRLLKSKIFDIFSVPLALDFALGNHLSECALNGADTERRTKLFDILLGKSADLIHCCETHSFKCR